MDGLSMRYNNKSYNYEHNNKYRQKPKVSRKVREESAGAN